MGLDELHLRVLSTSSEDLTEKRNAKKGVCVVFLGLTPPHPFRCLVLNLMQKGRHWVLVVRGTRRVSFHCISMSLVPIGPPLMQRRTFATMFIPLPRQTSSNSRL